MTLKRRMCLLPHVLRPRPFPATTDEWGGEFSSCYPGESCPVKAAAKRRRAETATAK